MMLLAMLAAVGLTIAGFGAAHSIELLVIANAAVKDLGADQFHPAGAQAAAWVAFPDGEYSTGSASGAPDEKPLPKVAIKAFQITKALVTVGEYADYYKALSPEYQKLAKPDTGEYCNWGKKDRDYSRDPINCVDWDQMQRYAKAKGARLPREYEWEYAARSGGLNVKYPWGDAEPTHDKAVYETGGTMPVCLKPAGNTKQGLCDMTGNVGEWMQDARPTFYGGGADDGSAWKKGDSQHRMIRGGSWLSSAWYLRVAQRDYNVTTYRAGNLGARLVKSAP